MLSRSIRSLTHFAAQFLAIEVMSQEQISRQNVDKCQNDQNERQVLFSMNSYFISQYLSACYWSCTSYGTATETSWGSMSYIMSYGRHYLKLLCMNAFLLCAVSIPNVIHETEVWIKHEKVSREMILCRNALRKRAKTLRCFHAKEGVSETFCLITRQEIDIDLSCRRWSVSPAFMMSKNTQRSDSQDLWFNKCTQCNQT